MPKRKNPRKRFVPPEEIHPRKHLNADALIGAIRDHVATARDPRSRSNGLTVSDALLSAFAMFALKSPSLLQFDQRRMDEAEAENLKKVYGMRKIPSDTQMREILDGVDPQEAVRPLFVEMFRRLQRGKVMEQMAFWDGHYLLDLDGTGLFSSQKLSADFCLEKKGRDGKTTYQVQMLSGAFVHPDHREVIPVCPEFIRKGDGTTKNDCEQNAAARFLRAFRREHPHLKVIVNEDALAANAPHLRELQALDLRYIITVKRKNHRYLFEWVDLATRDGKALAFSLPDKEDSRRTHRFRIVESVPLNASNEDLRVNVVEYWQEDEQKDGTKRATYHNVWITDLSVSRETAYEFMRGARARWRIENEVFNTLKNQGYHAEHNYGLGKQNLIFVFALLMMLAFLVDQIQQLCCPLFQAALERLESKKALWDRTRALFQCFHLQSMATVYRAIIYGLERPSLEAATLDSS